MSGTGTNFTLLLPARERLGAQPLPDACARALARADALPPGEAGTQAQLLRHFTLLPRRWPVAALTRGRDTNPEDAASAQWLRADPAWVRPDINGARLFAVGEGMSLAREDAEALLPALRTLFGDAGFPIDAPHPSRWYLRLPPGARLPTFPAPAEALGTDLFDALVGTDPADDANARRWRSLLSEAQVVLHNHPWNARREQSGLPPVNSLWFWGGGTLPDHVTSPHARVRSDEVLLQALATLAGARVLGADDAFEASEGDLLVDLRAARDLGAVCTQWWQPALEQLQLGGIASLRLDFGDGAGAVMRRSQRWRFWRSAASGLSRLAPLPQGSW